MDTKSLGKKTRTRNCSQIIWHAAVQTPAGKLGGDGRSRIPRRDRVLSSQLLASAYRSRMGKERIRLRLRHASCGSRLAGDSHPVPEGPVLEPGRGQYRCTERSALASVFARAYLGTPRPPGAVPGAWSAARTALESPAGGLVILDEISRAADTVIRFDLLKHDERLGKPMTH